MTNDYKKDQNKPPVLDALVPFYPALRELARCMDAMQHKHRLHGAKDPFNEWRQLPQAKKRLMNAAAGHLLQGPWKINTQDGEFCHAVHALFGVLAGLTIHMEDNAPACCASPEAKAVANAPDNMCGSRENQNAMALRCLLVKGHAGAHNNLKVWW